MKLYDLGHVSWIDSQIFYHTLPRMGREALIICQPDSPYVSIGFHQDLFNEVDLDYCKKSNIPVFRREVGGGTVYLDQNQIFFQLVLHKKNPLVQPDRLKFYRKFLQPVIRTLCSLNIPAQFKPHCDIVVNNRKISGNGAGEIGESIVFVGNLLLDFDFWTMARILMVPDESFRQLLQEQMQSHLTTVSRELNLKLVTESIKDRLICSFKELFGSLPEGVPDESCIREAEKLKLKYTSQEWLTEPGRQTPFREIKIAEGIYARSTTLSFQGSPINAACVLKNEIIEHVELTSPDQSSHELQMLEKILLGRKAHKGEMKDVLCKLNKERSLSLGANELLKFNQLLTIR